MVSIVEAATTISPALVSRSLITAMVMIGCIYVFLFLSCMKRAVGVLTPRYLFVLYHLFAHNPHKQKSPAAGMGDFQMSLTLQFI